MTRYWIGIDAGTHTGVAVWDSQEKEFFQMFTMKLWEAMNYIIAYKTHLELTGENFKVIVEDARKRKWFGERSNAKQQGAGSIKRDCTIWEEFLTDNNIPFEMVAPIKGCTKLTSMQFQMITKWNGRTSEHARDAAMLVFGR